MAQPDLFATPESNRLEALAVRLRELDEAYYRHAQPIVSDQEYDALRREYDDLADAANVPESDRYTRSVGDDHSEGFETVVHAQRMLSLEKAATQPDFLSPSGEDDTIEVAETIPGWENGTAWGKLRAWASRVGLGLRSSLPALTGASGWSLGIGWCRPPCSP